MKFECHQVEDLEFRWGWSGWSGWSGSFVFLVWSRLFFRLASATSGFFFWKFSSLKKGARVALKSSQLPSKSSCTLFKPWKRKICVHTELPKRMPFRQCKQKVKYSRIMGFRKKPFKNRDCTLSNFFWVICELNKNILLPEGYLQNSELQASSYWKHFHQSGV